LWLVACIDQGAIEECLGKSVLEFGQSFEVVATYGCFSFDLDGMHLMLFGFNIFPPLWGGGIAANPSTNELTVMQMQSGLSITIRRIHDENTTQYPPWRNPA
jgi:hypothetical protein